jgi:CubicO group peptidase (beta-lactamase class C family)
MPDRPIVVVVLILFSAAMSVAQSNSVAAAIDGYIQPYVRSENFSGGVLVKKNGNVIFEKAYGFADRERRIRNTTATRFHVASMSMQFTAAALLRLVDNGSIRLDERVANFAPGIQGADKIAVRDLLTERSGLPDINALPDYKDVLRHHQTPSTLIAKIEGKPLLFEPGSKFLHEEHSAYNLLAFILEKKTGLPFAAAMERLIFRPAHLTASGVDDDSVTHVKSMARGYKPEGTYGLAPADSIYWSAKSGNASVYTTARDEAHWVDALFSGNVLSPASREAVLDTSMRVGYGWFKGDNKRFGEMAYYMNGRAPGFASFVLHLPHSQTTVVVLSNIYSSATTSIGYDIAALSLGLPYERFHPKKPSPSSAELRSCVGAFQFGADFYQANARIALSLDGKELLLRWPSGETSALIPVERDRFIDRAYWEEVKVERDELGNPDALVYDKFKGLVSRP